MSRGKLGRAKFCPWCGTKTLVRDSFSGDTQAEHTHVSYICTTCSTGFSIRNSPRARAQCSSIACMPLNVSSDRLKERIRQQVEGSGRTALTERTLAELREIERLLSAKRPYTRRSQEHIERSLQAVRNELTRRTGTEPTESHVTPPRIR